MDRGSPAQGMLQSPMFAKTAPGLLSELAHQH